MRGRCGTCEFFPGKGGQVCPRAKWREKVYALDYTCPQFKEGPP